MQLEKTFAPALSPTGTMQLDRKFALTPTLSPKEREDHLAVS